jgi:ATP-dependent helicase HrpB
MLTPPTDLPIEAVVDDLASAFRSGHRAVLVAPPGSGKTTIVPLRLLERSGIDGKIVVLEPRRLATRAAARRMSFLIGQEVGATVGYVTRDDRHTSKDTRIEVVTEGVLTRRLQRDPALAGTVMVVFDEFHERNLQTDLGLALTLDSTESRRSDLKLLVMSATLDAHRVADLIDAPVVTGFGRMHPVEMRWSPLSRTGRLDQHVASVVRQAMGEPGDILVFLPGMAEIERVARLLEGVDADVHLLHGSLSIQAQDAALLPSPLRKIVLSTDIAETSLTVEGVRIVVDSGQARAPRFDPHTGMTKLRTVPISKSSAEQRAGRAGRTEPGVAYRIWSLIEHGTRRPHSEAEITQVDLAGLALELVAWGKPDPSRLSFLDQPPSRTFREGRDLLTKLGAIDGAGTLTDTGRRMLDLPLHPRLARMVVDADHEDRWLACVLAAVVDERDPFRSRPGETPPADLSLRVEAVSGIENQWADRRAVERLRVRASDLARRVGADRQNPEARAAASQRSGAVLALAYPDRLAIKRGSAGRFQLRTGTTAFVAATDSIAGEGFLIAADLDGRRKDARIRLAAAIDADDVALMFSSEVETKVSLQWSGDRVVARTERRLGGLALDASEQPADPGPDVARLLAARIRKLGFQSLDPDGRVRAWLDRLEFAGGGGHHANFSERALLDSLEDWLGSQLNSSASLDDLEPIKALTAAAPGRGRQPPSQVELGNGRRVKVTYPDGKPRIAVRAQDLYGVTRHPEIGGVPLVVEILSPANRPVQITSDLPGFWKGSWAQVRKEMMARYPKHDWPADPTTR